MKIAFIITFSVHLGAIGDKLNRITYLIPVLAHAAFPVLYVHFQGDDGTAIVFGIIVIIMLIVAGLKLRYFAIGGGVAAVAAPILYFFVFEEYQKQRILSIFDLEADLLGIGYQQWRGRMALANGGFTGQGLFKGSLTQIGGVPEGQNDFIFVSIGEELGFLGCMAVLIVLAAICLRAVNVARKCQKKGGKIICVGFFGMIFAQIIINIGMCVALLPVIGVTLPFFSAGGTSLVCVYLGVGLVMSVYMHRNTRTIYLRD